MASRFGGGSDGCDEEGDFPVALGSVAGEDGVVLFRVAEDGVVGEFGSYQPSVKRWGDMRYFPMPPLLESYGPMPPYPLSTEMAS